MAIKPFFDMLKNFKAVLEPPATELFELIFQVA
jgi:hypothetical protein